MKVMVIGKGGREHALVRAFSHCPSISQIHAIPGNDGMKREALCHAVATDDFDTICNLISKSQIDLVVIGPEAEVVAGLGDKLREKGVAVFAPGQQASQLEASKIYAKEFMVEAGVPTAPYFVVRGIEETLAKSKEFEPPFVLKADGLAAGKGVFICETEIELKTAAAQLFEKKIFGKAGEKALLEQFQPGWEMSYHILTNGESYRALPLAQDHKRLLENNKGPNTGGMGTVAPLLIDYDLDKVIHEGILKPTVDHLKEKGLFYRGVIFLGLMITEKGPTVLEYNVRFGDPETQVLLPLLNGDWGEALMKIAQGELPELSWKSLHAACVVLAAGGYPEDPEMGVPIEGDLISETPSSYFLHAGTKLEADQWVVNGGRVLNSIGLGSTREEALQHSYDQLNRAKWAGMQYRKDIGSASSEV